MAFAEAQRLSWASTWPINKQSSRWTDDNTDAVSTHLAISRCSFTNNAGGPVDRIQTAAFQMQRDRTALPDVDYGTRTFNCRSSDIEYWGDVAAGTD